MQKLAFQQVIEYLQKWNGRRRLRDALIWIPRGVLAGLLLVVALAAVSRLRPFLTNLEIGAAAGIMALTGLGISFIFLLLRRFTLIQQAQFSDTQFALQERVSTAVEIHNGSLTVQPKLAEQQLHNTIRAMEQVQTAVSLPFQINRQDWLMILLAIVLLITAVFLPNAQEERLLKQRALAETIEEQVDQLEALAEEIIQNPELSPEQQEELTAPLESAIEQLQEGEISQEEAVAALSESEADLRDLAASNDTEQLRQSLENAGQPLAENSASQSLGESLQNGDLSQAGAAAAQLADNLPSLSDAELSELAQDLAETAAALEGVDDQLAQQFADAATALQNGDIEAAQQALRDASATLQQRAQETAVSQQAQSAAGQLSEGRQDVAQSGQTGQQGEGQQAEGGEGAGQGQGSGEGSGESSGQGEGNGEGAGQGQGQGAGSEQGGGVGGTGEGGGHTENVYVPELVDLSGTEGVDIELPAECVANPADCGQLLNETPTEFGDESSIVPYEQVFGDYRDAANEALAEDYVPLGLKGYIRDYFTSLEP